MLIDLGGFLVVKILELPFYGVRLSCLWLMVVTAHLISNSFILNNMVSLYLVEKRERTTKQNTRGLFVCIL